MNRRQSLVSVLAFGWLALLPVSAAPPAPAAPAATPATPGQELTTRITHVTIYPEWAYVTREATVDVPAGNTSLVIRNLPAWIDDESIRARLPGATDATLLAAAARTVFLARSTDEDVRKAEAAVTELKDAVEDLNAQITVLESEAKVLAQLIAWKLDKVPHEAATRKIEAVELKDLDAFYLQAMNDNVKKAAEAKRKIRTLQPDLQAREKAWAEAKRKNRLELKEITVDVAAAKAGKLTVAVDYLISGASWYPSFDARTDAERTSVQLGSNAIVQQSSGEDWSEAGFTLSTVNPYATRQKPELDPWLIDAGMSQQVAQTDNDVQVNQSASVSFRANQGKQMDRLAALQRKQYTMNEADADFQKAYKGWQDNVKLLLEVVRQAEERGTTVEFEVPGRFLVKSDGLPVRLPIGEVTLPAQRRYSAAPAVSQSTYVTGLMRNAATFPFLPGPVKIFISGSFVGKSQMAFVAANEKFELYLGLEERIKVTREMDAKTSSTAMFSGRKRLNVGYRLKVKNFLKTDAAVEVRDQVPVSQSADVKVKVVQVNPRADQMEKGVMTWNVPLKAGEEKELAFEFQLEYPPEAAPAHAAAIEAEMMSK